VFVSSQQLLALMVIVLIVLWLRFGKRKWSLSATAHGTARWCSDAVLKAAGMLGNEGLALGRTLGGTLIRLPRYTMVLLVGSTGGGKGVGFVIPNMLTYFTGSVVCNDTKGDIYQITARRRGGKIVRLAPFNRGEDGFNPLDVIQNDAMVVDNARALAEALVVRTGMEHDSHWQDKAVQCLTAILVYVLLRFTDSERSLVTVAEIVASPKMIAAVGDRLLAMGGLPGRLGDQLLGLFDPEGQPTKEGSGVFSTMARHLSFLDSELVANAVTWSSFDPYELLRPGMTVYLQIPPDQLQAQRGLLRCWTSALMRLIGSAGGRHEVLFMFDEASGLDNLPAVEEALVRGRSGGVRLCLIYQSASQVEAAFKDKKTLIYDNCDTQIYLKPSSIETAEKISKSLGNFTEQVNNVGSNDGQSWQAGSYNPHQQGTNISRGSSENWSVITRPLLRPEEILTMDDNCLIVFTRHTPPIWAKRIKYYADPAFTQGGTQSLRLGQYLPPLWYMLVACGMGLLIWALCQ
jgi:type IV secretion system protein VirD4